MCKFKSGIIFKTRCVVAPGENDSHSDLLRELNIEDTYTNASRVFVRAELVPENSEWWTDPDGWKYVVDQDVTPGWYDTDPGKYEEEFRQAVKVWWSEHVIVDKVVAELTKRAEEFAWGVSEFQDGYYAGMKAGFRQAIQIVKGGGVDG